MSGTATCKTYPTLTRFKIWITMYLRDVDEDHLVGTIPTEMGILTELTWLTTCKPVQL